MQTKTELDQHRSACRDPTFNNERKHTVPTDPVPDTSCAEVASSNQKLCLFDRYVKITSSLL